MQHVVNERMQSFKNFPHRINLRMFSPYILCNSYGCSQIHWKTVGPGNYHLDFMSSLRTFTLFDHCYSIGAENGLAAINSNNNLQAFVILFIPW